MLLIDNREETCPAVNLAIEEYAVRRLPVDEDYLLIYRNNPSVIIGKHQNHVQEVNLRYCAASNIPILRRISGGGAVYHDLGNLNFGIVTGKTMRNFNQYREFLHPILKALKRLGVGAALDQRNNIVCGANKLSGNAQFTSRERLLSHGTLLVNVDLDQLRGSLSKDGNMEIQTRATKSIPAPIMNAADFLSDGGNFDNMKDAILNEISAVGKFDFNDRQWGEIQNIAEEKFSRQSWNLELSPPCLVKKWDAAFIGETEVKNGKITSMIVRERDKVSGKTWDLTPIFGGCIYNHKELLAQSKKFAAKRFLFNPLDYLT